MNNKTNSINVITFLRLQKGMTRAELAAATGLKPMDITRAERGNMPSLAKYVKLRAFLNISLDILMRNDFARLIESFTVPIKALHRLSLKLDSTNAKNSALGRSGEDYVYEHERSLLKGTKWENAINPNFADDQQAGFDILSFTSDGRPKYIEVKTTTGKADASFEITSDELAKMRECMKSGAIYEIYRVHHFGKPNAGIKIISAEKIFTEYEIVEKQYFEVKRV